MDSSVGRLAGALALIAGVIFPLVMVGWLAFRMNRKPALAPNRMGLILALNLILPVGLVLLGFGLLSPSFGAQTWVRIGWMVALAASGVVLVALGVTHGRRAG